MNYFEDYRKAHDEMRRNVDIAELEQTLRVANELMADLKAPYLGRMIVAEEGIKETVLDQQRTIVLYGVEATFSKPRKSTSWKGVAMSYGPSDELIEEHSKTGHPSVKIKVQEIYQEQEIQQEDDVPF